MPELPTSVIRKIRSRQSLLWVCQRYDLKAGEQPHDLDLPASEAILRYRTNTSPSDKMLSSLYWEAVWLEGAKSPLLAAFRAAFDETAIKRQVVILTTASDAVSTFSSNAFLGISVLPGLLDSTVSSESQYGVHRARVRERIAWSLTQRLEEFPRRVITVVGCRCKDDASALLEAIEDLRLIDLDLVLVAPDNLGIDSIPGRPDIRLHWFVGTEAEFADYIVKQGAHSSQDLPSLSLRVGSRTIRLDTSSTDKIQERFFLITEQDLERPKEFTVTDLSDFFQGKLDSWKSFGAGLPVPRDYTSEKGRTLEEEVLSALKTASDSKTDVSTITIQLPVEGGSGATTLLRHCAYRAAEEGFPTLLLRPGQVEVQPDHVLAFSTSISEMSSPDVGVPAMLIVADVEHSGIAALRLLPQFLASRLRRAVIIYAFEFDPSEQSEERRSKKSINLRPLTSGLSASEIQVCAQVFAKLDMDWNLGLELPSQDEWAAYQRATSEWHGLSQDSSQLFWVALRFFLTERMPLETRDRFEAALGCWIEKRFSLLQDERMRTLAKYVAALSSYRLPSPLWTVMRPVTGGHFSSSVSDMLRDLDALVEWVDRVEDLGDQALRFRHPALADEYLRRQGVVTQQDRVALLDPVFAQASSGQLGDIWLLETFAATVVAPRFGGAKLDKRDWDWRLDFFNRLPSHLRETSKTILHHWARCLYLSASSDGVQDAERRSRIELSIAKLDTAIALPKTKSRDELPSHLLNTLGTAYGRLTHLLDEQGATELANSAWTKACAAFRDAIDSGWGANLDTLLGFSERLVRHAELQLERNSPDLAASDLATALSQLDEAEQILSDAAGVDTRKEQDLARLKSSALHLLRSDLAARYLRQLQEYTNSDLGFYCEAQLAVEKGGVDGSTLALEILDNAELAGVHLGARSLRLKLKLLKHDVVEVYNFSRRRALHQLLEREPDYRFSPLESFDHAVLCYQCGAYDEGSKRFRQLREKIRLFGNTALRTREIWRDHRDPSLPKMTHLRVARIFNDFRGEGYIEELLQTVPFTPRHFAEIPKLNDIVECAVRFGSSGPLAIPRRMAERV